MKSINDSQIFPAVHFDSVTVRRGEREILWGIDWRVEAGEFAALLGPNGSGKSTMARVMLGYLWATRGQVRVAGRLFGETNLHDLREIVRLVQPNGEFDLDGTLSVREAVRTGVGGTLGAYRRATAEQERRVDELIERVGLTRASGGLYGHLSTGERVRCLLARALVNRPTVLILDEPTSGLDVRGREELLAVLEDLATEADRPAVVMITHHVEELPRATTNVLLLDEGRVAAAGRPADVLTSERLSAVYGCPVELRETDGRYFLHAVTRGWRVTERPIHGAD
ncbi:MAG TPA: ATP-binding cassette domain-containing protein [Tepidisphaeraceae bacterium]|jgi:iron complex transport system ATP-binding protein